jgi:cysteine desulfurase/selenocysteine lyase
MEPMVLGGMTVFDVSFHDYKLLPAPQRFEGGTPNIPGIIGLGRAVDYVEDMDIEEIDKRIRKLTSMIVENLTDIKNVTIYGKNQHSIVSFNVKGLSSNEVGVILDKTKKIAVRTGHHCAIPLMRFLDVDGTVRASVHCFNTEKEINTFTDTVKKIAEDFGG